MARLFVRSICLCLIFASALLQVVYAQEIIWADKVLAFSSQKSDKLFAATQALGKPNRYPNPSFSTCAWSPEYNEGRDSEYVHVAFKDAVIGKQLFIAENNNAGHILRIYLTGPDGTKRLAYNRPGTTADQNARLFVLNMKDNTAPVASVLVVMDKPTLVNTYQIDAIGISAVSDAPLPVISLSSAPWPESADRLSDAINSTFDEVYPVVAPDGKTLYFDRKLHPGNIGAEHADDIWYSELTGDVWTEAVNIGPPLNNKFHNFLCSISPDGNTALVGNTYNGDLTAGGGVSIAARNGNTWSAPVAVAIDNFHNLNPYNEFNLSASGHELLMSIETPYGNGLLDLYVSFRLPNGNFSTPLNLGNMINTAGNEMTPFLAADGMTMYFASNGFPGYGNQDIFMSKRLDDSWQNWSAPVNLGPEVNTPEWDVYFSVDARGEYGYYSSSKSAVTNLDIFRIKMPPELQPEHVLWLKGRISDRLTGQSLKAKVSFASDSLDVTTGSGNSGTNGLYAVILPGAGTYRIVVSASGYLSADTMIDLSALSLFREMEQHFSLVPGREGVIIQMRDILFKVNSNTLEDTSFAELDRIARFLDINPGVAIEIRGHTNGLCDDQYCNQLSTRRAKTVMEYFIDKGIDPKRLTYRGYGKTMPIADNNTPEGRRANQRVEFMIMKIND